MKVYKANQGSRQNRHAMRAFISYAMLSAAAPSAATEVLPELRLQLVSALSCCLNQARPPAAEGSAAKSTPGPMALEQLIEQAIHQHPSVGAKRADMEVARADVELARQAFYPTPSVLLQQGRSSNGTLISLQQPLWSGGRLTAGADAASARAMAADVAITEAQYAVAQRVVNAYQSWLQAQHRIAAFAASVKQLTGYDERISRRVQAGASAEVDRVLVRARLLQAESDLLTAQEAERAAIVQLTQAIGYKVGSADLGAPTREMADQRVPELAKLVDEAVRRHPTLRRIDFDIAAAQYEAAQKRAALWPTISLRAEHQRNGSFGGASGNDNRLSVVLEYTPGAGLSATTQINGQLARTQSLRESADATRRDLVERVAVEYQDYLSGKTRRQALQDILAANRDVLASYERLFIAGKRGWLDVINAARELTQSEVTDADLAAQQVGARYRLRLLAGEQPWLYRAPAPMQVVAPFRRLTDTAGLRAAP